MTSGEQAPSRPRGKRASLRRAKSHQPACSDSSNADVSLRSLIIDPGYLDSMGRIEFSCLISTQLRQLCRPAIDCPNPLVDTRCKVAHSRSSRTAWHRSVARLLFGEQTHTFSVRWPWKASVRKNHALGVGERSNDGACPPTYVLWPWRLPPSRRTPAARCRPRRVDR